MSFQVVHVMPVSAMLPSPQVMRTVVGRDIGGVGPPVPQAGSTGRTTAVVVVELVVASVVVVLVDGADVTVVEEEVVVVVGRDVVVVPL